MFAVFFWDFDCWDEFANTRFQHKQQAVELANKMNKEINPQNKSNGFCGRRFRVMKVWNIK